MLPAYELSVSVKEDEVQFFRLDETGEKQKFGPQLHAFVLSDDFADGFTGAFTGVAVPGYERPEKLCGRGLVPV